MHAPLPHASTFGGSGDPHMWRVTRAVRDWWERHGKTSALCVALSGGADSLALTAGAVRTGAQVTALIVDHQLQEGSGAVAAHAAEQARQLGCRDAFVTPLIVNDEHGQGMEAAAREARYAALDMMRGGQPVLIGHTQDDQAETLLLGLVRGSGPRAIAGMRDWEDPWGRPLLGLRRADTRAACAEHGIDYWDDPHNSNLAFTRVRIRHELLPLLQDISGGDPVPALARTAQLVGEDTRYLDQQAAALLESLIGEDDGVGHGRIAAIPALLPVTPAVEALDVPTLRRVLRLWLQSQGATQLGYVHLSEVARLVADWHGQGAVPLPGGASVSRSQGALHLEQPHHCSSHHS